MAQKIEDLTKLLRQLARDVPRGGCPNILYLSDFPGGLRRNEYVAERLYGRQSGSAHRRRGNQQHQELSIHRTRATRPF